MTTSNLTIQLLESRKNILLLYILLGIGVWVVGLLTASEIGPATVVFLAAIVIAYIFYHQINVLISKPSIIAHNSLKNVMYIFLVVFVLALGLDVLWWGFLTVTSFLGAILAIAGYFLMNQIITESNPLAGLNSSSFSVPTNYSPSQSGTKIQFCANCGESLKNLTSSNFCPKCGQKF